MKKLLFFCLLFLASLSGFTQVHKLTYREVYNFNVGDEIYYSEYFDNPIENYFNYTKQIILNKKYSNNSDTIFYKTKIIVIGSAKLDSFFITNLDDTIFKLNGINQNSQAWTDEGIHGIATNYCNVDYSEHKYGNDGFDSDTICYKGLGCFSRVYERSNIGNLSYEKTLSCYIKQNDTCGTIYKSFINSLLFIRNCTSAREIYDVQIGDEYIFERKTEGMPTEIIYRKLSTIEYYNNSKSLKLNYEEKRLLPSTKIDCLNCLSNTTFSINITNLDTCVINNDLPFNYDIDNNFSKSIINQPCIIPIENYKLDNYSKGNNSQCGNYLFYYKAVHSYIKGLGYLQNKKFTYYSYYQSPWYNQNPKCKVDTASYRDIDETLLYIKNKFYNCGEMPDIFKRVFKNETENYVNILPNPVQFGEDVIGYKSVSANISSNSFTDELGRFLPTVQIPTCIEKEITFTIPHQYFHTGLNIISFQFDDGHQEIHKIIVF